MVDLYEEGLIKGSIDSMTLEKINTITDQMKNYVYKVYFNKTIGTGFFCKILYQDKLTPVMITNYHVIDDSFIENNNKIKISINDNFQFININQNSKIYSSQKEEYDIMIIRIKEDEIQNYLELDQNIFLDNSEELYKNESIYILHYPSGDKVKVSFGFGIEKISDFEMKHLCNTESGSSGGPIFNLQTNKIIGIHRGFNRRRERYNIGTFLKFPLNELNKNKGNEIRMKIKIDKEDANREVYFLDNTNGTYDNYGKEHYHDYLKELNEFNTELYIDNKKVNYNKYFIPEKEGIYSIKLKFNIFIKDCSYMFFNCDKLIEIDLSYFDTRNIIDIRSMFRKCSSLNTLSGISNWDTTNVTNMSHLFLNCTSLKSLPDISKWNTKNVKDMRYIFSYCTLLKSLPDISSWDTTNVTDMSGMFCDCCSLSSLPDISKWNTINVTNMRYMFYDCSSLEYLPNINKWNKTNLKNVNNMFDKCSSLKNFYQIINKIF